MLNDGVTVAATTFGVGASGVNVPGWLLSGTASATLTGNFSGASTGGTTTTGAVYNSGAGTLTINGDLPINNVSGGAYMASCVGTGNLTIVGACGTGAASSSASSRAVSFASTGSLSITGNLLGGTGSNTYAVYVTTSPPTAVTIVGNVTAGTSSTAYGIVVELTAQPKTFTITGAVTAGALTAAVVINDVNCTIIGAITASSGYAAVQSTSTYGTVTVTGPLITSSTNRRWPLYVRRVAWRPTVGGYIEFRNTTGANGDAVQFASADLLTGNVAASHVRKGTTYGPLTGTCAVPTAAQVQAGVAVDATTGTALLTATAAAAAVWDYLRASAVTADSMGQRLANTATVDSTGAQLAAL